MLNPEVPERYHHDQLGMEDSVHENRLSRNSGHTSTKISICILLQGATDSSQQTDPPRRNGSDEIPRCRRMAKTPNIASAITPRERPVGCSLKAVTHSSRNAANPLR